MVDIAAYTTSFFIHYKCVKDMSIHIIACLQFINTSPQQFTLQNCATTKITLLTKITYATFSYTLYLSFFYYSITSMTIKIPKFVFDYKI